MDTLLPSGVLDYLKKRNLNLDFKEYINGYGYLMQKIYDKSIFNDLHLPSTTYIAKDFKYVYLIKKFPIEFESYSKDLEILKNIYKEYIPKFIKIFVDDNSFFILSISKRGEILRKLTNEDKQKVIRFFKKFYANMNSNMISRNYFDIVNLSNYKIDKNIIISAINSRGKNKFDKMVVEYFQLVDKFIDKLPYDIEKRYSLLPLQGDFRRRNIVWQGGDVSQLIDYEMSCNGVLELEYIQLIKDLYGDKSKIFKQYIFDKNINNLKYLIIYLYQELLDLSVFKSAFCINSKYYLSIQNFLKRKIKVDKRLIKYYLKHYSFV